MMSSLWLYLCTIILLLLSKQRKSTIIHNIVVHVNYYYVVSIGLYRYSFGEWLTLLNFQIAYSDHIHVEHHFCVADLHVPFSWLIQITVDTDKMRHAGGTYRTCSFLHDVKLFQEEG